jgi:hypothetical protein
MANLQERRCTKMNNYSKAKLSVMLPQATFSRFKTMQLVRKMNRTELTEFLINQEFARLDLRVLTDDFLVRLAQKEPDEQQQLEL